MRENCTYGSMRGSRRKTAKSVLRVAEGRAGVPDNKGRPALLYTLLSNDRKPRSHDLGFLQIAVVPKKVVHTSSPLAVDLGYNLRCQGGIQL